MGFLGSIAGRNRGSNKSAEPLPVMYRRWIFGRRPDVQVLRQHWWLILHRLSLVVWLAGHGSSEELARADKAVCVVACCILD